MVAICFLHGPSGNPYEGYALRLEYDGAGIPFLPHKVRLINSLDTLS